MANTFVLELDGKPAARLISLDSAGINTQVISNPQPFGSQPLKVLTGMPGEIKVKFGADASRSLLEWMVASAHGRYSKKTGTIIVLDARNVVLYRIEFFDAQVTSFTMPALNRSTTTPAYFSASFRPTSIKHTADGNKATSGSTALPAQKVWNASNFRFRVGDVPLDDGAVTKVSSISLSTAIKPVHFGKDRLPELEPTKTSYSNVVITVPMSEASGILSWAEEVVSGRGFDSSDKTASLEYMAPGDKMTYYTAELKGLGIVSAAVSKSGAESSKDVIAELYYDSIKLSYI